MKRSDFFIRLTTGVLFLAVAFYIGFYLYNALVNTYETTRAISYAIEETLPAQGYIVRTETVLEDSGVAVLPIVGEGVRVAVGQAIAVEYLNLDALETASEIRALRFMISQLETTRRPDGDASFEAIRELSAAVINQDLSRLDEISLSIETNIFTTESADLSELQRRLSVLESRGGGTRTINTQVSGTFSHVVDGFEHIMPETIYGLGPTELNDLFSMPLNFFSPGKIITEFKWYYAAVMNHEEAALLSAGQTRSVQFFGAFNAQVDMLIEAIGRREDGLCVVLFSSDRGIHDVAPLRFLRADIVSNVITGIRVPKEALHLDDDLNTFIYLQTSGFAERVDVDVLRETGDSVLVRDGVASGTPLRVDSIIIVRANDLYHGKVVG